MGSFWKSCKSCKSCNSFGGVIMEDEGIKIKVEKQPKREPEKDLKVEENKKEMHERKKSKK